MTEKLDENTPQQVGLSKPRTFVGHKKLEQMAVYLCRMKEGKWIWLSRGRYTMAVLIAVTDLDQHTIERAMEACSRMRLACKWLEGCRDVC